MFLNHKNFSVISDLPGHVFGYSQEPARALRVLAHTVLLRLFAKWSVYR